MNLNQFYEAVGGDLTEVKARFMTEDRILRFLNMFPKDGSMVELTTAIHNGDAATAFRAAHTLKGVALNLGLGSLAQTSAQLTEVLRGATALPECKTLYDLVYQQYKDVQTALESLKD